MKTKQLLALMIFALWGLGGFAQPYQWQWAKAGGGESVLQASDGTYNPNDYHEEIVNLKTTSDNNTYLLSHISGGNTNFDDIPITTYHTLYDGTNSNILIAKVDCEGNYLWHKTFGGASNNKARSMDIDANDNIYIGMSVNNTGMPPDYNASPQHFHQPVHFDNDSIMSPVVRSFGNNIIVNNYESPAHKKLALIKYNAEGEFQWLRMPQSDLVTYSTNSAVDYGIYVESNGTIHWMVGLYNGNHLDGQLPVSGVELYGLKYYILKYDSNGNFLNHILLPMRTQESYTYYSKSTNFTYDPATQQYYFTSYRSEDLIYEPKTIIGNQEYTNAVLICMNSAAEIQWIKESNNILTTLINDILVDEQSNVYISGIGTSSTLLPDGQFGPENGNFAGYQFTTASARKAFVIKFNSQGNLLWGSNAGIPIYESRRTQFAPGIALNGNEIAVATGFYNQMWGGYGITGQIQVGAGYEPILIRLNSDTGESIGAHRIYGHIGFNDALTAVEVDKDGNYIVGGYMRSYLFATNTYEDPIVGKLNRATSGNDTDFFIAKLAKTTCNTASTDGFTTLNLKVYPNPTTNNVFIDTPENLTTYEVYNLLGQRLVSNSFNVDNSISLETFAPGTYFIKVTTDQNTQATVKVIKK